MPEPPRAASESHVASESPATSQIRAASDSSAPSAVPPASPPPAGRRPTIGLWLGPALFLLVFALPFPAGATAATRATAAVAALMAVWWMTEALPLAATALLPLALFPMLGVLSAADAASPYANPVIFLFLGGFVLALSMERWGLHRRIALFVVSRVGTSPRRLVGGFMIATALVSMWISNTATAAMMVPIGIALIELLRPADPDTPFPFGTALMLGIAYAATIGGVGTLIGTPPNAVFAAAANELLGRSISFTDWMVVGVPLVIVMLPVTWALLVYRLFPPGDLPSGAADVLAAERRDLGPMSRGEALTMAVFFLAVFGWLAREPKVIGALTLPGLTQLVPGLDDSTIAIAASILLFLLPAGRGEDGASRRVMDWATAKRLPWGVLLLFGGGLALAAAFEASGLTRTIAQLVGGLAGLPTWILLAAMAATFIYLSELASNTAVAAMAMPVLAAAALGLGQPPLLFMALGALAASTAFMLPVGTPPNAIAFGSGRITMAQMIRAGFWLNLFALVLDTLIALVLVPLLLR
ncbi:MAG: SLC13 family permease [Longimicrobiales bacterium]